MATRNRFELLSEDAVVTQPKPAPAAAPKKGAEKNIVGGTPAQQPSKPAQQTPASTTNDVQATRTCVFSPDSCVIEDQIN